MKKKDFFICFSLKFNEIKQMQREFKYWFLFRRKTTRLKLLLLFLTFLFALITLQTYSQLSLIKSFDIKRLIGLNRAKSRLKPPVNGCILSLVRNTDLSDLVKTITRLEQIFNGRYHYPYVLINDQEFDPEFKATIRNLTKSEVGFGIIPKEQWAVPDWIDQKELDLRMNTTLRGFFWDIFSFISGAIFP